MINHLLLDYKSLVDDKLNSVLPDSDNEFNMAVRAARYSLFSGGKRIRPFILNEFYKLCGGSDNKALCFAAAIEMIHTYSLIHDDLPCMDNDDMRRGNPSCHKAYGEDIALLAGDALLTAAFSAAVSTKGISADLVVKAVSVLSARAGINGMIGGQVIDISTEGKEPDIETLTAMYFKKTGCLLSASAEIGCILAGADDSNTENAALYAENLGLAFQVIDDILDETGDESVLGKPVGSDEKNSKTTFATVYGVEKARSIAADFTNKALDALSRFDGDTSVLKQLTEFLLIRDN